MYVYQTGHGRELSMCTLEGKGLTVLVQWGAQLKSQFNIRSNQVHANCGSRWPEVDG